jgi:hypothetical protein
MSATQLTKRKNPVFGALKRLKSKADTKCAEEKSLTHHKPGSWSSSFGPIGPGMPRSHSTRMPELGLAG